MSEKETEELSESAKSRIEENRKRALLRRNCRLVPHPNAKGKNINVDPAAVKIITTKFIDSHGGFLREVVAGQESEEQTLVEDPPPIVKEDRPFCIKCDRPFAVSWLFDKFNYKCCDECRDSDEHALITKTDAIDTFLLKPVDLEKREPPLQFITKKNPHNVRWGDMKLYLKAQVKDRALEVWGSLEGIEEERKNRNIKRVETKAKKHDKKMKALRMKMRSSVYDCTTASSHTHKFGPETYNEEDDTYTHKCLTCPYVETFEKM